MTLPLDARQVRERFPYLDSCVYLNTAAVGLSPKGIGAAAASFFDEVQSRGYDAREQWRALEPQVQAKLAQLLKVDPKQIGFTSSTTEVLNLIARSVTLSSGDRIVFAADDFPSVRLVWEPHRARGVELHAVQISAEVERTAAIVDAIIERTRIVCVSHVHWCTGTRVDLREISNACRKHGARLIVDGVQAVGAVDVDASFADVYAASTFKWLLSAFGLAVMVVREEFAAELQPANLGYFNEPPSRSLRYSHLNYPALGVLNTAMTYMESLGWSRVFAQVSALTDLLATRLQNAGWTLATPLTQRAGIVSVAHPQGEQILQRLAQRGCRIELRDGLLRFSPHFYNLVEDIERAMAALRT